MQEPTPGVRKVVTALFCDVSGSTALGERVDPEIFRSVLQRYFQEFKAILERHGGTVEKFVGDAVMAVFGVPTLHEDDALRAVRAAVEMVSSVERLNRDRGSRPPMKLQFRIGVQTGEVVAGDPSTGQAFVTGDAVNVAARLEQTAEPGEILIGASTFDLVRDAVRAEPVGPIDARGKSKPLAAYRVLGVLSTLAHPVRRLDSPMVGRELELAQLRDAYERAVAGPASVSTTLVGDAGVGKTRLVEEFLRSLPEETLILRGRCLSYGEGITFWPVGEAVKTAAEVVDTDSPDEARSKIGSVLRGDDDGDVIRDRVAAAVGLSEASAEIQETFWALRRFLEALARRTPVVLVIDDLQWAEDTLLDFLDYLRSFTHQQPLLQLCMARPDLFDVRTSGGEPASVIRLHPLSEAESERLVENLLGPSGLPEKIRGRILTSAHGNPLFVGEMLRMLLDQGILVRNEGRWVVRGEPTLVTVPDDQRPPRGSAGPAERRRAGRPPEGVGGRPGVLVVSRRRAKPSRATGRRGEAHPRTSSPRADRPRGLQLPGGGRVPVQSCSRSRRRIRVYPEAIAGGAA